MKIAIGVVIFFSLSNKTVDYLLASNKSYNWNFPFSIHKFRVQFFFRARRQSRIDFFENMTKPQTATTNKHSHIAVSVGRFSICLCEKKTLLRVPDFKVSVYEMRLLKHTIGRVSSPFNDFQIFGEKNMCVFCCIFFSSSWKGNFLKVILIFYRKFILKISFAHSLWYGCCIKMIWSSGVCLP